MATGRTGTNSYSPALVAWLALATSGDSRISVTKMEGVSLFSYLYFNITADKVRTEQLTECSEPLQKLRAGLGTR